MLEKLVILILSLGSLQLAGQTGKEFWFAAPDATSGHADAPVFLRVSTYNANADISLSLPADPSFTPLTVSLAANSSYIFNLTPYMAKIENGIANAVRPSGIRILSTANITAYYEIGAGNNTDIFALKGDNALGTSFMISAQQYWTNGNYNPVPYATSHIVATANNTTVTITPSVAILGHPAGVPFTVNLDKGETYTIRATGQGVAARFPGTEVSSNKPIAITIADDSVTNSAYGGCKDIIGDQTIPLENIGSQYVIVRGFLGNNGNKPDRVYIMSTQDNAQVYLNGSAIPINLNKGDVYEEVLYGASLYIDATADVYVMHVTGFGCEVGMAIVPSINCTGSDEVSFSRSQAGDFYMVVFVPAGAESNFSVNGDTSYLTPGDFSPVPGTAGTWLSARKKFSNSKIKIGNNYRVNNTSDKFHLGIINGGSTTGCLYGFFTDFSAVRTDPIYHY